MVSGVTGDHARFINGIWDRSEEVVADLPIYFKRGDPDVCIEYYLPIKRWIMKILASRGKDEGFAFVYCEPGVAIDQCTNTWRVSVKGAFVDEASVKVVRLFI